MLPQSPLNTLIHCNSCCKMGLSRNPTLITVALVISCVGLLLHIIGYASPYWYNITLGSIKAHGGIWRECLEILGISSCSTVKGDTADSKSFYKEFWVPMNVNRILFSNRKKIR